MSPTSRRPAIGPALYLALALPLGAYFTFAAVQGNHGLFRRVQLEAQAQALRGERDALKARVADMSNRTRRLSDDYLDLDLLDEQARKVLGYVRGDEIIVR